MTFKVMDRQCDQCLYGPNKIVREGRRREILRDVHARDGYFECHKGTMLGEKVCCRGDFDAFGGGQLGRIMDRLNAIEFVSADEYEQRAKAERP